MYTTYNIFSTQLPQLSTHTFFRKWREAKRTNRNNKFNTRYLLQYLLTHLFIKRFYNKTN